MNFIYFLWKNLREIRKMDGLPPIPTGEGSRGTPEDQTSEDLGRGAPRFIGKLPGGKNTAGGGGGGEGGEGRDRGGDRSRDRKAVELKLTREK